MHHTRSNSLNGFLDLYTSLGHVQLSPIALGDGLLESEDKTILYLSVVLLNMGTTRRKSPLEVKLTSVGMIVHNKYDKSPQHFISLTNRRRSKFWKRTLLCTCASLCNHVDLHSKHCNIMHVATKCM